MDKNIRMIRGDTLSFGLEFEGLEQDLESAYFTVKSSYSDTKPVFQKSLDNGITKSDTGKYRVRVAPEDTKYVEADKYFYDLQIGVNSDIFTILKGTIDIEDDVTV